MSEVPTRVDIGREGAAQTRAGTLVALSAPHFLAGSLLSGIAIWGVLKGSSPNESLLLLLAFMGAISVTTLAVAAAISEHKRTQEAQARTSAIAGDNREGGGAEQLLALQSATTRVLQESSTLREAAPGLLRIACVELGWDVAELWMGDVDEGVLRCLNRWPLSGEVSAGDETTVARGSDLPGRIWESGRHVWIEDLASDRRFARECTAARAGMRAALAGPIWAEGGVVGVLALYARDARSRDTAQLDTVVDLNSRLGLFIDRVRAIEALNRLKKAVETLDLGVTITDMKGRILYTNPAEAALHGYSVEELVGKHVSLFVPPSGEPAPGRPDEIRSWRRETANVRRDGTIFPVQLLSDAVTDADGVPIGIATVCEEISERKQAEQRIEFHAYHDPLTQLPNRMYLQQRMQFAFAHARRSGQGLTLVFLDLDQFKAVNDRLGHAVGDQVLQDVARRLRECVRVEDTVARVGGDEFVLLLADVRDAERAARIALKLLERIEEPFHLDGHELSVTTSLGIALYPHDGKEPETLLRNADSAMYRAKELGGSGYQLCDPTAEQLALERIGLQHQLRHALERDELAVVYQPQVELGSGRIVEMEALLRWRHPEKGMVPPAEFVPLAEDMGLIARLGEWVLRKACAQASGWKQQGLPPVRVAVNLSMRQFRQADLKTTVERILTETSLSPRQLDLEITETAAMQNFDLTVPVLRHFAAMGIVISIDDFGTGYSSLSRLKLLPVRRLKVDRSFVAGLGRHKQETAMVKAIIRMAHSLGLRVVAEGVETEEQVAILKRLRCDAIQGWVVSDAVEEEACERLLSASAR